MKTSYLRDKRIVSGLWDEKEKIKQIKNIMGVHETRKKKGFFVIFVRKACVFIIKYKCIWQ